LAAAAAAAADAPPAWEHRGSVPAETEFLLDRLQEPQNHFLLDGEEGFVAGREFYQNIGEAMPFLWPVHPFLRFGPDRRWETDSSLLAFSTTGAVAPDEGGPLSQAEIAWSPLEEVRLHAGLDQNALYSRDTRPFRRSVSTAASGDEWAWYGSDAPIRSQAELGGAFSRRGSTLAAQFNRGWWWTTSPVTGEAYPWEGFNADFFYHAGDGFDLSLAEQQWDSPTPFQFYKTHWRRSELNMSFLGSSEGSWVWRFDIGYERRALSSEGAFAGFEEKTYPVRFRYRQDWEAPDSLPFRMINQGSLGYRQGLFLAQHGTELKQPLGTHQPMEYAKAYYRYRFGSYYDAVEQLTADSQFVGTYAPGDQNRGVTGGAEYREVRKSFLVGVGGNYTLEWELPLFQGGLFDTLDGLIRRQGIYQGSDFTLQNATGRIFASGALGEPGNWKAEAGIRQFWGHDADSIEFLPSPWWVSAGAGYGFGWKPGRTRLDAQVAYVGPKEVRHWGPVFKVDSHLENHVSLSQTLFSEKLKLTVAALHAFGDDFREHPNGNPVRFRVAAGLDGTFE
jgi:hypothetical protein